MAEPLAVTVEPKHVALWQLSPYACPEPGEVEPTVKQTNWRRLAKENREEHERNLSRG